MKTKNFITYILICCIIPISVFADGGFFYEDAGAGNSADQTAILIYHPEFSEETMILHTEQSWENPSDKSDYAWIVPIPSLINQQNFTTFEDASATFDALYQRTEPKVHIYHDPPVCGGGCLAMNDAGVGLEGAGDVTVIENFQVDEYDITILSAEDSENLHEWLNDNGYSYSEADIPTLQYYIDKDWYFTAVKISTFSEETRDSTTSEELNPLQIIFNTEKLIFPLKISSISTENPQTEILLYVFAPYRVKSDNFTTLQMHEMDRDFSSKEEFRDYYDYTFTDLIDSANGKALIVEYAMPYDYVYGMDDLLAPDREYYLTRLRTEIAPQFMNDDIEFVEDESSGDFMIGARETPRNSNLIHYASILSVLCVVRIFGSKRKSLKFGLNILLILVILMAFVF